MLKHLSIQNYILIDKLEIEFDKGLCIITGETGAGKSILLGALGLILGNRADSQALLDKSRKCVIEAVFNIEDLNLESFFQYNELDYESQAIIRREINPAGKSRAFINDTPVTLQQIKELTEKLIDIHSQHQTLLLNDKGFQLGITDSFAQLGTEIKEYNVLWKNYTSKKLELKNLLEQEAKAKADLDYWTFQYNELNAANLKVGELSEAEEELNKLNNTEEIRKCIVVCHQLLDNEEQGIIPALVQLKKQLQQLSRFGKEYETLLERVETLVGETKDIHYELERSQSQLNYDPERAEYLTSRIDTINHLLNKHRLNDEAALIQLTEELSRKINDIENLDSTIEKVKQECETLKVQVLSYAKKLSEKRHTASSKLAKELEKRLKLLSIPEARVEIRIDEDNEPGPSGIDKLTIFFSANKGIEVREIAKAASGGEMSRIMLALKSLISERSLLPTIIFDEIDSGISGATAGRTADILKQMSQNMQVIAITHLPQISAKAKQHFKVLKETINERTQTRIVELNTEDRIKEIARMLSGSEITEAALKNAQELMRS